MQKLADFVPALSHHLKPLVRDNSQLTCMLFHPRLDGGIPLDSAIESQQLRSHRLSTFCLGDQPQDFKSTIEYYPGGRVVARVFLTPNPSVYTSMHESIAHRGREKEM